jgi:hypothetical protein
MTRSNDHQLSLPGVIYISNRISYIRKGHLSYWEMVFSLPVVRRSHLLSVMLFMCVS